MNPSDRLVTASYPDNLRNDWVIRMRSIPSIQPDKLLHMEYEIYPSERSRLAGDKPFLINSHKAMVRENHQRISLDAQGNLLHVSGIAVPFADIEGFLKDDPRAYRWLKGDLQEWTDDRGRTLPPFQFPSYWGMMEALGDASAPTAAAIADAVWDEALAGHLAAGSTGLELENSNELVLEAD